MAFVKLDCGLLNSTLWFEKDCRDVFLTALLLAEPREYREPVEQIKVDSLELTGWSAPAGWYGYVPAAGPGLARVAMVEWTLAKPALEKLGSPEIESRSQDFDGRRMIRIDGGYLILNFIKYRERDTSSAERSRRWRERNKRKSDSPSRHADTPLRDVIRHQAEAEAEAEAEKRKTTDSPSPSGARARKATGGQNGKGTRLLDGWKPDDDLRTFAIEQGLEPDQVAAQFCDYWRAVPGSKGVKADWPATWRNWCRREAERNAGPVRPNGNGHGGGSSAAGKAKPSSVGQISDAIGRFRARRQAKPEW